MKNKQLIAVLSLLNLPAATARELMVSNPMSIGEKAAIKEAIVFLSEKEFTAAPVIDDAGRPVGVVNPSDIVRYEREPETASGDKASPGQLRQFVIGAVLSGVGV